MRNCLKCEIKSYFRTRNIPNLSPVQCPVDWAGNTFQKIKLELGVIVSSASSCFSPVGWVSMIDPINYVNQENYLPCPLTLFIVSFPRKLSNSSFGLRMTQNQSCKRSIGFYNINYLSGPSPNDVSFSVLNATYPPPEVGACCGVQ